MVLAEMHFHRTVLNAVTGQHTAFEHLLASLLDGRDEVVRNRAADDVIDEREVARRLVVARPHLLELALVGELLLALRLTCDLTILWIGFLGNFSYFAEL